MATQTNDEKLRRFSHAIDFRISHNSARLVPSEGAMSALAQNTLDLLALTLVPGIGPRLTAALIAHFGSARAVRLATAEQFREVTHVGEKLSHQFVNTLRSLDLQAELDLIAKHNVSLLSRWQ